jgi:hypothetical protein
MSRAGRFRAPLDTNTSLAGGAKTDTCTAVTAALLRDRTGTRASPPVRADQPPPPQPSMIPLTIPEIMHPLAGLTSRPLPRWLVIHWDAWTRRHQARPRWFHKRARLTRDAEIALVSQ